MRESVVFVLLQVPMRNGLTATSEGIPRSLAKGTRTRSCRRETVTGAVDVGVRAVASDAHVVASAHGDHAVVSDGARLRRRHGARVNGTARVHRDGDQRNLCAMQTVLCSH